MMSSSPITAGFIHPSLTQAYAWLNQPLPLQPAQITRYLPPNPMARHLIYTAFPQAEALRYMQLVGMAITPANLAWVMANPAFLMTADALTRKVKSEDFKHSQSMLEKGKWLYQTAVQPDSVARTEPPKTDGSEFFTQKVRSGLEKLKQRFKKSPPEENPSKVSA
jgi:hypothetical protein